MFVIQVIILLFQVPVRPPVPARRISTGPPVLSEDEGSALQAPSTNSSPLSAVVERPGTFLFYSIVLLIPLQVLPMELGPSGQCGESSRPDLLHLHLPPWLLLTTSSAPLSSLHNTGAPRVSTFLLPADSPGISGIHTKSFFYSYVSFLRLLFYPRPPPAYQSFGLSPVDQQYQ